MDLGLPASSDPNYLVRKLQELDREVQRLKGSASNLLVPAGIRARKDAVTIENALITDGSLTVNGAATINGPMTVAGTLSLPAGIIDNEALAAPVKPGSAGLTQQNFGTTSGGAVYAQATITVPDGYSQALVMNGVMAGAVNSTTNPDYLYVASSIDGVSGGETATLAPANNGWASATAFGIRTLTGLTGGTITVGVWIRTGAAWAANASATANVNTIALFLK